MKLDKKSKKNNISLNFSVENPDEANNISFIGRALSSPVRIAILRELNQKNMLLSEIATKFNLPLSSTAFHMNILEEANLVRIEYSTKGKGSLKWYSYSKREVKIVLRSEGLNIKKTPFITYKIGIGEYINAHFSESCGIATETGLIMENSPNDVYIPTRYNAQLIWFKKAGWLLYAIPNSYFRQGEILEISISLEICSEINGYNNDYPSDITFWINDFELCTYMCPGDFGDRYGKFTPSWWYKESTKYGLLTTITIKENGIYLNEKLVDKNIRIDDLKLGEGNCNTIKIGVKDNATHKGGLNIFGEKFGDFSQAIIFTARYK